LISSSRMALAAWSTSIIIARWKCATETLLMKRGTGGSNPLPSRGESDANLAQTV
jgi:hypothetical protein